MTTKRRIAAAAEFIRIVEGPTAIVHVVSCTGCGDCYYAGKIRATGCTKCGSVLKIVQI